MLGQGCLKSLLALGLLSLVVTGCATNKKKYEQRDKVAAQSGLYCDFINGDKSKEVEVDLNISMAKKCDSDKNFSITGYKNAAEIHGVMYCCSTKDAKDAVATAKEAPMSPVAPTKVQPTTQQAPATKPAPAAPTKPGAPQPDSKPAAPEKKEIPEVTL